MKYNFRGEYYYSIDHKGRLSIPKKFATQISQEEEGKVFITRGTDNCLWVYPLSQFEEIKKNSKPISPFDPEYQKFYITFLSGHDDVLDKMGRVSIPKQLLEDHAHIIKEISKEIVIVGAEYRIQIWSLDNWKRQMENSKTNVNMIASSHAHNFIGNMSAEKGTE